MNFKRTLSGIKQWQYEAFTQIRQAYDAAVADYEAQLASQEVSAGIEIEGRSPTENRRLERDELKKQVIAVFTRQHFERFGAIEKAAVGEGDNLYPQIDLNSYARQGEFIRFFEQAFEWPQMTWVAYPYYWSRKEKWLERLATTGADPQHVAFLRAGAARLQMPVRPGFEPAVLHYQATGEIWQGDHAPPIYDETYLPIVQELAEQLDRPIDEQACGDPWEVRLPTNLVKLNPDGMLPQWEQDEDGNWHPISESGA